MKKVLVLLVTVLAFNLSNAQVSVPKKDSKKFTWKNGYGKEVKVDFANYTKNKIVDNEVISKITIKSLVDAKYVLKNKLSFVPVKLTIMDFEEGIVATVDFRGKNAYGSESEIKGMWKFDNKGVFLFRLM